MFLRIFAFFAANKPPERRLPRVAKGPSARLYKFLGMCRTISFFGSSLTARLDGLAQVCAS